MQAPDGYTIRKCLRTTPRCEVVAAVRERDGLEVVLKRHLQDPADAERPRVLREFEALRAAEPGSAVRAIEVDRSTPEPVLVLQYFKGSAPQRLLAPKEFLEFALRATEVVAGVHRARWVHQNLQPENFLIHPVTREVRLAGFSRATPLGAAVRKRRQGSLESSLFYMAPEQTGRLERGIDARTDLYALGVVFYEVLTGFVTFEASDPFDLMHAHVARRPRSPLELRPELPPTIARIVLRLLEKDPGDRYQTDEALLVDLECCLDQLSRTGCIDDTLPLASGDAPYRPHFRRAVYGRDRELQVLTEAYRRAAAGGNERILIHGSAGIGKSSLVPELHRPVALDGGYLVQGKFDLYRRHRPYAGFVSAVRSLAEQMLSESDSRLQAWAQVLHAGLGRLASVMVDLVPDLSLVLGELPPAPPLGSRETQHRLALAVERFLVAAAAHARPLVLFMDDMQWADAGSLVLLEELLRADHGTHFLLVCAYRDNEVDPDHPFARLLQRLAEGPVGFRSLALEPIPESAVRQMLGDALGYSAAQMGPLAEVVSRKSGNVPLLVQQCVYQLHKLGAIRFESPQGWVWDPAAIAAAQIPDSALGMMIAKLERLPPDVRAVIQLGSCVGDRFDAELLLELRQLERKSLEAALYALSDDGLIAPCREGFQFVHDRIREAAHALLSESERAALHGDAAMLLLDKLSESERAERALEIADHLVLAASALSEEDRGRALETHVQAGKLALRCGAASTASRYLAAGRALLQGRDWEARPGLCFDLLLQSAESAHQSHEFDRALEMIALLEQRPLSTLQKAEVAAKKIAVHILRHGAEATLRLVLDTLAQFGVRWPRSPSWLRTRLAIWKTDLALRAQLGGGRLEVAAAEVVHPEMAPVMIMRAGGASLSFSSVRLACLSAAHALQILSSHGYLGFVSPGLALAVYACHRRNFLRRMDGVADYGQIALDWAARAPHPTTDPRLEFHAHGSLTAWTRPHREALDPLRRVAEAAREVGDLEFSYYALRRRAALLAQCGERLPAVEREFRLLDGRGRATSGGGGSLYGRIIRLVRFGAAEPEALERELGELEERIGAAPVDERLYLCVLWRETLCLLGRHEWAGPASEREARWLQSRGNLQTLLANYLFARGISAAELATRAPLWDRWRSQRMLSRSLRELRAWAARGPDFVHMADALDAERARLRGHHEIALDAYARAAARALGQGYRHHAALLHERRAALLAHQGRASEATRAREQSSALYEDWGARTVPAVRLTS